MLNHDTLPTNHNFGFSSISFHGNPKNPHIKWNLLPHQHQSILSYHHIPTPSAINRRKRKGKNSPIASKKGLLFSLRIPHPKPRRPESPLIQRHLRIIQQFLLPFRRVRSLKNPLHIVVRKVASEDLRQQFGLRYVETLLPHADPELLEGGLVEGAGEGGFCEDHSALGLGRGG